VAFFLTFSGTVDSVGSELEIINLRAAAFVGEVKINKSDVKRKREKFSEFRDLFFALCREYTIKPAKLRFTLKITFVAF